jgi:hypothetical protein
MPTKDPIEALALEAQYDLLVDRLRHAIQFAEAARKMAQDALELVEAHKSA